MAEYIEREAVLAREYLGYTRYTETEWQKGYWDGVDDLCAHVKALPAADVAHVVRCKECKHNYGLTHGGEYCSVDILCEYWATDGMHENDYCSRGKRKDGETDG